MNIEYLRALLYEGNYHNALDYLVEHNIPQAVDFKRQYAEILEKPFTGDLKIVAIQLAELRESMVKAAEAQMIAKSQGLTLRQRFALNAPPPPNWYLSKNEFIGEVYVSYPTALATWPWFYADMVLAAESKS